MTESSPQDIYSGTSQALEFPKISFRRMTQLVWKTWPFMRPMLKHIIVLLLIGFLQGIIFAGSLFVAGDIFTNKAAIPANPRYWLKMRVVAGFKKSFS